MDHHTSYNNLVRCLSNQLEPDLLLTLTDTINERTMKLHRIILKNACPYFAGMFEHFYESTAKEITMTVPNVLVMCDIINEFYGDNTNLAQYSEAEHLMEKIRCYDFLGLDFDWNSFNLKQLSPDYFNALIKIANVMNVINEKHLIDTMIIHFPDIYYCGNQIDYEAIPKHLVKQIRSLDLYYVIVETCDDMLDNDHLHSIHTYYSADYRECDCINLKNEEIFVGKMFYHHELSGLVCIDEHTIWFVNADHQIQKISEYPSDNPIGPIESPPRYLPKTKKLLYNAQKSDLITTPLMKHFTILGQPLLNATEYFVVSPDEEKIVFRLEKQFYSCNIKNNTLLRFDMIEDIDYDDNFNFLYDSQHIVHLTSNHIYIYNLNSFRYEKIPYPEGISYASNDNNESDPWAGKFFTRLCYSPTNAIIAFEWNNKAIIYDLIQNKYFQIMSDCFDIKFSPGGQNIIISHNDWIGIYKCSDLKLLQKIIFSCGVSNLDVSPVLPAWLSE